MNQRFIRFLLLSALAPLIGILLFGYSYFIEPRRLVATDRTLSVSNFDPKLNGLKIVAVSDIHGGSNYVTPERLREIVTSVNSRNPDIVVLLGDYVSQAGRSDTELKMPVGQITENLMGFRAQYGVYAVIGNHDWWYSDSAVRNSLEMAGIKVLENEVAEIDIAGAKLKIWGIEDFWKNRRVPAGPFDAIADKRNVIAITHNPDSLLRAPAGFSLMLAGHSHGGQVNFPFFGPKAFVNDPRFMYGEAVVDGKRVYVTGGVGTSVVPLRFRVPPEIAVLTIKSSG